MSKCAITTGCVRKCGFEMEYFRFGEGKRDLVIIPGINITSVMLSAQAVADSYSSFYKDFTVTVFDRKKNIEEGYSTKDMADDTACAMDEFGIHDACVFGASNGGMMAQHIAAKRPELVKRLAIGSSLARQNEVSFETFKGWARLAREGNAVKLNRDIFEKVYSQKYRERYKDAFSKLENVGSSKELERYYHLSMACLTTFLYDELDLIKCPTLVIGSECDRVLSGDASREIAEKLHCELYMYDGFSHAVYDEDPENYRKMLFDFFTRT